MQDRNTRSFRIPMIELVIIISVFAIISVFIMQLFLFANSLQKDAVSTRKALIMSESIGEMLKASSSFEQALIEYGLERKADEDNRKCYILYFDKNWMEVEQEGLYAIEVKIETEKKETGFMETADITAYKVKQNDTDELDNNEFKKIWSNLIIKKFQT